MQAICIIALLLSLMQQGQQNEIRKKDNQQKPHAHGQSKNYETSPNGVTANYEINEPPKKTKEEKDEEDSDKKLERWYWGATIAGVGISLLLFGALIWQNILTRRAANAAQASANAIKTSERPWILLSQAQRSEDRVGDEDRLSAYFKFKNFGMTPAFIISITGGVAVIPKDETLTPVYKPPHGGPDELLLAQAQESGGFSFALDRRLKEDEFHRLFSGEWIFVMFGEIRYSDTFRSKESGHTSKFCYRYDFGREGGFYFTFGPKEWNEYT